MTQKKVIFIKWKEEKQKGYLKEILEKIKN